MHERIKEIRNALGLTQQEFADAVKVKRNTVATYEMGRSIPSDAAVALICKQFEVNENWLRTGEGEMFVKKSKDEQIGDLIGEVLKTDEDSFKRRLVSALSKLDESEWGVLEKLIDSIAEKNK
jgi:transcriptional regulator with XRE-family HTH domain|nr:MAG TPA: helix-turn-helix domain protein [Bacteriophage sp.]